MANEHNLMPIQEVNSRRTREKHSEDSRKAGIASGEARRTRRAMKDGVEALLREKAPDSVIRSFHKLGYDIETNYEGAVTSIVAGALKGKPESIRILIDLLDENPKTKRSGELFEVEKRKAEAEAQRAEMETELFKMRLDAIKGVGQEELPDDGFLDALKSTAAEDWSDDIL